VISGSLGTPSARANTTALEARDIEASPAALAEIVRLRVLETSGRSHGGEDAAIVGFRRALREDRIARPLLRAASDAGVHVADEEIDLETERRASRFVRPRALQLRSIHLEIGDQPREQIATLAAELRARILEGEDFGALAREHSSSQSRFRDGRLGWIDPTTVPRAVADAVEGLEAGRLSSVVEQETSFSVLLCEAVREQQAPTPAEARERVRQRLVMDARERAWESLLTELVSTRGLRVDLDDPKIVLEMDGLSVRRDQIRELVGGADDQPPRKITALLQRWAQAVAVVDEVRRRGLDSDPRVQFELAAAGVEALAQWELTRRVDERLREPTEAELEAFRQSQARRYRELEAIDLAVIQVLDTAARPDEDTKARLERARAALLALDRGEVSFAEVATQLSLHRSGPAGGSMGWLPRRNVAHTFAGTAVEALRELEDGGHTGLLRFPSGTWILQRRGWRESREQSLAEAREAVAEDFREQQIATLTAEVEEELLQAVQFDAQDGM
jgi:parvulin-like peptidyl-prolyl isomerase